MAFEELIQDMELRKERARAQGGPEKIRKQHDKGKLTARERVGTLLDEGSFFELGALCASDIPGMEGKDTRRRPGDRLRNHQWQEGGHIRQRLYGPGGFERHDQQ